MNKNPLNLLLADDDEDDCVFFKEALEELEASTVLTVVNDGVQLMQLLSLKTEKLPHALYLDLNMPRKNGLDCLSEIKQDKKLKHLPVIIFSTSFDTDVANRLHDLGAHYYIRKPAEFHNLKNVISISLELISNQNDEQPAKESFVLNSK